MFTMRFYDVNGNKAAEVTGLTKEEVDGIYKGILSTVAKERKQSGKDYSQSSCFNSSFPTVWDEETGSRVSGY